MTTHIFKTLLNRTERGLGRTKEFYILFQKSYVNCARFFFGHATAKNTPIKAFDHLGHPWDLTLTHTTNGEYRIPSLSGFFEHHHVVAGDLIVFEAHEIDGDVTYSISHERGPYDNLYLWSSRMKAITAITSTITDLSIGHYHIIVNGKQEALAITKVTNGYEVFTPFLDGKGKRIPLNKFFKTSEYFSVDSKTREVKPVQKIRVQTISR